jgi:hypothetical protein
VPASTLLLPYFEVDLDDVNGESTSFRVANSSPLPVIAHVVLWSDWAIPTFGFEIYLDGNGAVDVDLHEVFAGRLPAPVPFVFAARTSGGIPIDPCSSPFLDIDEVQHLTSSHSGLPLARVRQPLRRRSVRRRPRSRLRHRRRARRVYEHPADLRFLLRG